MEKLTIRGAEMRHLNMAPPGEGEALMRLHLRADLTGPVQEAMGWEDLPVCLASPAKLSGELNCTSAVLTPNGKPLAMYERCLQILAAEDFRAVPLKDDSGEITGHALELSLKIADKDSQLAVVALMQSIGRADCAVELSYEVATQQALGLESGQPTEYAGSSDEPESAGEVYSTISVVSGDCPIQDEPEDAGPLPSAVSMAGSTEKLRRQRRDRAPRPTSDPASVNWDKEQAADPNVPHSYDSSAEVM